MVTYGHHQAGHAIRAAVGTAGALVLAMAWVSGQWWLSLTTCAVLAVAVFLFGSLSIAVTEEALVWQFGPGLIRRHVQLADLDHVEIVHTSLLNGWGIHWTSRGWLYNVSGFGAVLVRLRNGKQFLLGSDEPEKLAEAIVRSLSGRAPACGD